jgi:hypothetical protein
LGQFDGANPHPWAQLRMEAESSLWNVVLNKEAGRWIMSRKSVIVLIHCCHKLLNLIYTTVVDFFSLVLFHACFECCKLRIQVLCKNGLAGTIQVRGDGSKVQSIQFKIEKHLISLQKWKRWKYVTMENVGNELVSCLFYFQKITHECKLFTDVLVMHAWQQRALPASAMIWIRDIFNLFGCRLASSASNLILHSPVEWEEH